MARIDWSQVDLMRPAKELAEELGVGTPSVYRARKARGIIAPHESTGHNHGGSMPGAGRKKGGHNTNGKMVQTFVRLREPTNNYLIEAANRKGISFSELVRSILEDYRDDD